MRYKERNQRTVLKRWDSSRARVSAFPIYLTSEGLHLSSGHQLADTVVATDVNGLQVQLLENMMATKNTSQLGALRMAPSSSAASAFPLWQAGTQLAHSWHTAGTRNGSALGFLTQLQSHTGHRQSQPQNWGLCILNLHSWVRTLLGWFAFNLQHVASACLCLESSLCHAA